jgi:uncharacterized protein (DUF2225 family)
MGDLTDALTHFRQSFVIYESYLGKGALETAKSALQLATILEEQGNDVEAYRYAANAAGTFAQAYGKLVDMTLTARW